MASWQGEFLLRALGPLRRNFLFPVTVATVHCTVLVNGRNVGRERSDSESQPRGTVSFGIPVGMGRCITRRWWTEGCRPRQGRNLQRHPNRSGIPTDGGGFLPLSFGARSGSLSIGHRSAKARATLRLPWLVNGLRNVGRERSDSESQPRGTVSFGIPVGDGQIITRRWWTEDDVALVMAGTYNDIQTIRDSIPTEGVSCPSFIWGRLRSRLPLHLLPFRQRQGGSEPAVG